MAIAIKVKFHGPSANRGSRFTATAQSFEHGNVHARMAYNHAYDVATNYALCAQQLAERLHWAGAWYSGELPDCFVFVRQPRRDADPDFCVAEAKEPTL